MKAGNTLDSTLHLLKTDAEKGIRALMQSYMGYVFTICRGRLRSVCTNSEIEECAADVFTEIYESRTGIDESKGSLKAFICTVARKKSADIYSAKTKTLARESLKGLEYIDLPDLDADIENSLLKLETSRELLKCIRELGKPDSEIFIRKYYFGQSTKEIAKAIGLKENTVDKRVSRGYVKLKQAVKGALQYDE